MGILLQILAHVHPDHVHAPGPADFPVCAPFPASAPTPTPAPPVPPHAPPSGGLTYRRR